MHHDLKSTPKTSGHSESVSPNSDIASWLREFASKTNPIEIVKQFLWFLSENVDLRIEFLCKTVWFVQMVWNPGELLWKSACKVRKNDHKSGPKTASDFCWCVVVLKEKQNKIELDRKSRKVDWNFHRFSTKMSVNLGVFYLVTGEFEKKMLSDFGSNCGCSEKQKPTRCEKFTWFWCDWWCASASDWTETNQFISIRT